MGLFERFKSFIGKVRQDKRSDPFLPDAVLRWGIVQLADRFLSPEETAGSRAYLESKQLIHKFEESLTALLHSLHIPATTSPLEVAPGTIPLRSIFGDLFYFAAHDELGQDSPAAKAWLYPQSDWASIAYPRERMSSEDFHRSIEPWRQKLKDALIGLPQNASSDKLLKLLERFACHIPATPQETTSVSIYDALHVAAAIAAGFPESAEKDEMLGMLLVADFSGIQEFVYRVSTKNALKTLRARSFFLELACHHFALEMLASWPARTTSANCLTSGAGKLYLWLPPHPDASDRLLQYYKTINEWLFEISDGVLHLSIQSVPVARRDLGALASIWKQLHVDLKLSKSRRLLPMMEGNHETAIFGPRLPGIPCPACGREVLELKEYKNDQEYCEFCHGLVSVGERLGRDFELIVGINQPPDGDAYLSFPNLGERGGWTYYTTARSISDIGSIRKKAPGKLPPVFRQFRVNDLDAYLQSPHDDGHLLLARHVFSNPESLYGAPADFEVLASKSLGIARLATLRMDVDYLSHFMNQPFDPACFSPDSPGCSLALFINLSRSLNYFFKYYIDLIGKRQGDPPRLGTSGTGCERSLFTEWDMEGYYTSVVYSGGDDLYVVGAWQDVLAMALDVESCFKRYVCGNPDMGVSGGFITHSHTFPVHLAAQQAGKALAYAKGNWVECREECRNKRSREDLIFCPLFGKVGGEMRCMCKASLAPFYSTSLDLVHRALEREYENLDDERDKHRLALALSWTEMREQVLSLWEKMTEPSLVNAIDPGRLQMYFPRQVLSKLLDAIHEWRHDENGLMYLPHLIYQRQRILDSLSDPAKISALSKVLDHFIDYREYEKMRYLHIPLMMFEFAIRDKEGER